MFRVASASHSQLTAYLSPGSPTPPFLGTIVMHLVWWLYALSAGKAHGPIQLPASSMIPISSSSSQSVSFSRDRLLKNKFHLLIERGTRGSLCFASTSVGSPCHIRIARALAQVCGNSVVRWWKEKKSSNDSLGWMGLEIGKRKSNQQSSGFVYASVDLCVRHPSRPTFDKSSNVRHR